MAKHRKVYRFRMKPTTAQGHALNRMAGARRFTWNRALRRWKDHSAATGKSIPLAQLSSELAALTKQPETAWLNDADPQALRQVLKDLQRAFTNSPAKRARYPKLKGRKRDRARFRIPRRVKIKDGRVFVPKIGDARIFQSQDVTEETNSATFKRGADGKWYVSPVVELEMPDIPIPMPDPAKTVGIDVGLIDYATFSDTTLPVPAPKLSRKGQRKLRKAQRTVSRRQKGSKRKAEAAPEAAIVHQEFADRRRDKCPWNHKHCIQIDRFFPSSRLCNVWGAINDRLTLSDREWNCDCTAHHQGDFHAACNIRDEGLRMLAAGQAGEPKRSGRQCDSVRPGTPSSCR